MSGPRGNAIDIVRPGEGVAVEQINIAHIRDELARGTYILDEFAQQSVHDALVNTDTSEDDAMSVLNMPGNKGFRVAYTSLLLDQAWPGYQRLATGDEIGLYALQFDSQTAILERQDEGMTGISLHERADQIAASNQAIATFFVIELLKDGRVPQICDDSLVNDTYFQAFLEQTDLQIARTEHYFKTVPKEIGSLSVFVASGLQSIRTHGFGSPNLIDGVSANENIQLTAGQHRGGVGRTYARSIVPYFRPTGPLLMAITKRIADPATMRLLPEHWMSNGDPDNYLVYPKPELVRAGNAAAAQKKSLPAQAGCPVVHGRSPNLENRQTTVALPRSLGQVLMRQLDELYYPFWQ